ncbi:carbohydrate-binding protein [Streptomyces odontomachi]|uniref:carbohydrate-binding protein n=1 Tax=Streptomyces odontomachi TaxID=2944940 RepID=UPI00210EA17F|nr:carbohydrate-binding protein [Streptomyces sp. ODS25]
MTPGNDGASTPEDDDPFGYLYADGQASGATPPSGGGGYGYPGPRSGPRTSYNQVRTVGERQYGQQGGGRGGYGYPPAQGRPGAPGQQPGGQGQTAAFQQVPSQGYDQPSAHYQAPETLPGGQGHRPGPPPGYGEGGGRGRGPNTKGLLIGAIAVVAAVVVGIGVAVLNGPDDGKDGSDAGATSQATATDKPSRTPSNQGKGPAELPKSDANALKLEGGSYTASDVKGAQAEGGLYVAGLNQPGASATWTVDDIPKSGKYTLDLGYGVPGKDATMTLAVNGTPQTTPLSLKNWADAKEGDWEKGWTESYAYVELVKGSNTLRISCEQGNQCDVNLDRVWLEKGWKKS